MLTNNGACLDPSGSARRIFYPRREQCFRLGDSGNDVLHYYAQDCAGTNS